MNDNSDRVEYLEDAQLAALPGIRHGFFTRNGGVSKGIYASLNAGAGSEDAPENVRENKRRIAAALGEGARLVTLNQVHSDTVVTVTEPFAEDARPRADGLVTTVPQLALSILTADCAPVLLADPKARVIGACHAGWKGAHANIMEKTVAAMEELGAHRGDITAVVGPCIGQASYEVGQELYDLFTADGLAYEQFFAPSPERAGHHHFDIGGYVRHKLLGCGIAQANLLAKDTCLLENAFFSNRRRNQRGEVDYGRQLSAIMLLPA